jgi:ABC-type lipoprotein export system ATPase subunit
MEDVNSLTMSELISQYPFVRDWLAENGFTLDLHASFGVNLQNQNRAFFQNNGCDAPEFARRFWEYIQDMVDFLGETQERIEEITILPGLDKSGRREGFEKITIKRGNVVAVVGATGSGKSRLLADIEWGAAEDTPTGRTILIDGGRQTGEGRIKNKIVAQLSQNMNFVIDLSVYEFLKMHAECRMTENPEATVEQVFIMANKLAGESFARDIPVTALSGGQSRALMIADCALLSAAPVVLIDEIENAGINRREALALLTGEDKIVFIATHDPVLALLADYRLIIKNGSITAVLQKDRNEEAVLKEAEALDGRLLELRDLLRRGLRLAERGA